MARIAIDIDSTLHPYWDQLRDVVQRRHGIDLPYEAQTGWDITTLPADDVAAAVRETHSEAYVLAAEPYPDAVETVRAWHAAGHFIHITSHRTTTAHEVTTRWLERIGLPFDELYCSMDKISRCLAIGIDVLIDDAPATLERAHAAGIVPATLRHPWNAAVCRRAGFLCADDWAQLREALAPVLTR